MPFQLKTIVLYGWKFSGFLTLIPPINFCPENVFFMSAVYNNHIQKKPVLNGHSKKDKTKVLKTNSSLMKVESIAECYSAIFLTCIKR